MPFRISFFHSKRRLSGKKKPSRGAISPPPPPPFPPSPRHALLFLFFLRHGGRAFAGSGGLMAPRSWPHGSRGLPALGAWRPWATWWSPPRFLPPPRKSPPWTLPPQAMTPATAMAPGHPNPLDRSPDWPGRTPPAPLQAPTNRHHRRETRDPMCPAHGPRPPSLASPPPPRTPLTPNTHNKPPQAHVRHQGVPSLLPATASRKVPGRPGRSRNRIHLIPPRTPPHPQARNSPCPARPTPAWCYPAAALENAADHLRLTALKTGDVDRVILFDDDHPLILALKEKAGNAFDLSWQFWKPYVIQFVLHNAQPGVAAGAT